jgi:two-component system sensor histidine kinase QseC
VLDRRLVEAAGMVASLATDAEDLLVRRANQSRLVPLPHYSRQLSCQIWTLDGRLVGRSSGAPSQPLADGRSGFSERVISGETWRVYTIADPARQIRVSVGDNLRVRQRLIGDLMLGLLFPAIAGLVALAVLIWAAVGAGLGPLREVARLLARRDPSDFSALRIERPTEELIPLIAAIDSQFVRLEQARADERHFIASAAHELQTPLAGLRAHADIASMTDDPATREKSLHSIRKSVDRTARLVGQLLDLSREESGEPFPAQWVSVVSVVESLKDEYSSELRRAGVELIVTDSLADLEVHIATASLLLALRNLIKNAIDHSPRGRAVEVSAERRADNIALCVRDHGPGIPDEELGNIRGRFVRGARARGPGSGLGLSIVELVLSQIGGRLEIRNHPGGGLEAAMLVSTELARTHRSPTQA